MLPQKDDLTAVLQLARAEGRIATTAEFAFELTRLLKVHVLPATQDSGPMSWERYRLLALGIMTVTEGILDLCNRQMERGQQAMQAVRRLADLPPPEDNGHG